MNVAKIALQEDKTLELVHLSNYMPWVPWDTCDQLVVFIEVEELLSVGISPPQNVKC